MVYSDEQIARVVHAANAELKRYRAILHRPNLGTMSQTRYGPTSSWVSATPVTASHLPTITNRG